MSAKRIAVPTKSRNVKRYVRAILALRAAQDALLDAKAEAAGAEAALNGAQRHEAERLLRAMTP